MTSALFMVAFFLFLRTACGTVSYDDSGEVCVLAVREGILHPPGYPLIVCLASLAGRVPLGCVAFRLNAISAALAAGAVCQLFRLWKAAVAGRPFTGWIGALVTGLALGLWGQAGTAKGAIYSLNALIVLSVLTALAGEGGGGRIAGLKAAMGVGLGLANHWMSIAGLLPGLAMSGLRRNPRSALIGAIAMLTGLSLYVILPVIASRKPFLDWGSPVSAKAFRSVVMREQYLAPASEPESVAARLGAAARSVNGLGPWWIVLGCAGAGVLRVLRRSRVAATAMVFYGAVLYASLLAYGPMRSGSPWYFDIFSIPATLILGLFAAAGLEGIADFVFRRNAGIAAALCLGLGGILMLPARWSACDRSREYLAFDLARNLAASEHKPAILFGSSDVVVFSNWYLWHVKQMHNDVFVVPSPLLPQPWVSVSFAREVPFIAAPYPALWAGPESVPALMRAWCQANGDRFSIYALRSRESSEAFHDGDRVTEGLAQRITACGRRPGRVEETAGRVVRRLRLRGVCGNEIRREYRKFSSIQPIYFSGLLSLANAFTEREPEGARRLLHVAASLAGSAGDRALVELARGNVALAMKMPQEAERRYRIAIREEEGLKEAWFNLAMAQLGQGRRREAAEAARRLWEMAPGSEESQSLRRLFRALEAKRPSGR